MERPGTMWVDRHTQTPCIHAFPRSERMTFTQLPPGCYAWIYRFRELLASGPMFRRWRWPMDTD